MEPAHGRARSISPSSSSLDVDEARMMLQALEEAEAWRASVGNPLGQEAGALQ